MSDAATADRERTNNQRMGEPALRCRITLRDGRRFGSELPAERHRAIQLGVLHRYTQGLVELTPEPAIWTVGCTSTAARGPSIIYRGAPATALAGSFGFSTTLSGSSLAGSRGSGSARGRSRR